MKLNADSFVGVGICILGLLGVGYAIGVHSKMKTVCEKLDTSIDRLANDTEVDIPAKVIDQAVQHAVDRESYSAVKRAIMKNCLKTLLSYALATVSGLCLVGGVTILSSGRQ